MKNVFLFLSQLFFLANTFAQQGVSINTTGAAANGSAILDVSSSSKGMLIPRMTSTQRTAILNTAVGLLVFDTNTKSFWFYQSTGWTELQSSSTNPWQKIGNNIYNSNSGNVGIGIAAPQNKLDVSGSIRADSLLVKTEGNVSDMLVKQTANGKIGFRKSTYGLGLNYCIALQGIFPSQNKPVRNNNTSPNSVTSADAYIGEIMLVAYNFAPRGWAFCNGQLLLISQNEALFSLLGTQFGGDGITTFALPDLRDATPVHLGSNWLLGESNK